MTKIKTQKVMKVGYFFCGYCGEHMCSVADAEFYYDQDNTKLHTVLSRVWHFFPVSYMNVNAEIVIRDPNKIYISDEDDAWDELLPWLNPNYTYCYKNAIYKFLALVRLVYGKTSYVFKKLCENIKDFYGIDIERHKDYLEDVCNLLCFAEICASERRTSLVKNAFEKAKS